MARSSKVEECMFCGAIPCECNAKPKKAAAKRQPKKAAPFADEPKTERSVETIDLLSERKSGSMRDAMKAVASKKSQSNIETLAQHSRWGVTLPQEVQELDEDPEFIQAVRVLHAAGLLHSEEVGRFVFLGSSQTRLMEWKSRYREATASRSNRA